MAAANKGLECSEPETVDKAVWCELGLAKTSNTQISFARLACTRDVGLTVDDGHLLAEWGNASAVRHALAR